MPSGETHDDDDDNNVSSFIHHSTPRTMLQVKADDNIEGKRETKAELTPSTCTSRMHARETCPEVRLNGNFFIHVSWIQACNNAECRKAMMQMYEGMLCEAMILHTECLA